MRDEQKKSWRSSFVVLLAVVISIGHAAAAGRSQQSKAKPAEQGQEVRLKSALIEVRAVVTNRQGQVVADLKKEDFELFENGQAQEIAFFSVEQIGDDSSSRAAPENKEALNPARSHPPPPPARTVLLFIDTLHLSAISLIRVKQTLRQFVDHHLTDRDVVAVVTSCGTLGLLQQFTQNRQMLRRAIDRLTSWQSSSRDSLFTPYLAAMVERNDSTAISVAMALIRQETRVDDPRLLRMMAEQKARETLTEAGYQRRSLVSTLGAVTEMMATMPGQRLIAFISDGFTMLDRGGSFEAQDIRPIISRAVRSGVVIYSLAAKGLEVDPTIDASRNLGALASSPSLSSILSASRHDLEDGMNALASDTGGEAFFNTNDLGGALKKALDDNRVYYALAYHPSNDGDHKQFRRLTIKVKNHPGYIVRAQKGYLPPDPKKAEIAQARTPREQLYQAIAAPLPLAAIGVAASAGYFEGDADQAQVLLQIHIDGGSVECREQEKRLHFEMEIATVVYAMTGKPVQTHVETAQGKVLPDRLEAVKQQGVHLAKRIVLKPGLYQIRVGVREPNTNRIGTAMAWVDVPDLQKGKLTLSSLALGDYLPTNQRSSPTGPSISYFRPAVTQPIKSYKSGDLLVYYLMIYNAFTKSQEAGGLLMQSEILQDGKPIYQSERSSIIKDAARVGKKGVERIESIGLDAVKPGVYELRVTVMDPKSRKSVERTVEFEVVPSRP